MGIVYGFGAMLCRAKQAGVTFERTATIGRLSLYMLPEEIERLARGLGIDACDGQRIARSGFADDFIRDVLGAHSVTSIDISGYQGASVIHDLNRPIDPALHRSFDCVIDGGTLEHIFDVRQALENYMNLVEVGGNLFIDTTANNLFGHGFYQFSSELFCRVFDEANGFEIRDLLLAESPFVSSATSSRQRLFRVDDPSRSGGRVQLVNRHPVEIFVHARRIADRPLFQRLPVQSDYANGKWARRSDAEIAPRPLFSYPTVWQRLRRGWKQSQRKSLRNRRHFLPIDLNEKKSS